LEKVAARSISDYRGGLGSVYVDEIVWLAKDLQADAVIHYNMRGCTAALGLRKMVEDRIEEELGIPTLQLEGAQWDTSYASEAQITAKLDEFSQMLLSQRDLT
jgi:benzoyl-CoA reductase/2-hydroxyglutaryl-CoA dehydratase subunit BcrC/BadD/HgdB